MAGYTAIANGETGLSVRGKLNTQLTELFGENSKAAIVVADETARLAIPSEYLATGKHVRQLDNNVTYEWTGTVWAIAILTMGASKFGDIAGGNYTEFESDGTLKMVGNATTWKDIIILGLGLRAGGTAPTFAASQNGIFGLRFDAGTSQSAHGAAEIPHDYMEGGALHFHVHWTPTTTNTGNIVWGLEYSIANPGATFGTSATVAMTPTAAPGIVGRHMMTELVEIVGTGIKIGAIVKFRIFRQNGGTDTFTGNAFLESLGVHYEADTTGSREETAK